MASTSFPTLTYPKSQSQPQTHPYSQSQLQPPSSLQRSSSAQRYQTQPIPLYKGFARSASHPINPGNTREDEKNFIAHHGERQQIVAPERVHHDPVNRKLGFSSRKLKVTDFELMKTLGTGTSAHSSWRLIETDVLSRHFCTSLAGAARKSKARRQEPGVCVESLKKGRWYGLRLL